MNTPVSSPLVKLLKEKDEQFDVTSTLDYPTIADVVMWLYEKHGIWISCEPYDVGRFKYIIINELNLSRKEITGFNSPTETYEAGIKYTLNELI